jgi:DNA end-binding protein Ku
MPTTIARMSMTFSLVSIPVSVSAATGPGQHEVPLHMVHAADGGRIRQRRICEQDGAEVPYEDIARGYEAPDGRTVVLTRDDLADLPLASAREIRVLGFLDAAKVDPIAFDRAYYLAPSIPAGARPYALLCRAMRDADQVGIARVALRAKESLAVLRVRDDVIVLQTLLWPDQVRPSTDLAPQHIELSPTEIQLARQLMDAVTADFRIEGEHDDYARALEEVVEALLAGLEAPHALQSRVLPPGGTATDLMAVLEAAIADVHEQHRDQSKDQRVSPSQSHRSGSPDRGP